MQDLKEFLEFMARPYVFAPWIIAMGLIGYGLGSVGL
jgi:hypothetical protein